MKIETNNININEELIIKWSKNLWNIHNYLICEWQDYKHFDTFFDNLNIRFVDKELKSQDKKTNKEKIIKSLKDNFPDVPETIFDKINDNNKKMIDRIYNIRGDIFVKTKKPSKETERITMKIVIDSSDNLSTLNLVNYSTLTNMKTITFLGKSIENFAKELDIDLLKMYEISYIDALFELSFNKYIMEHPYDKKDTKRKNFNRYFRVFFQSFKVYTIIKYLESINDSESKDKIIKFIEDNYLLDEGGFQLLDFPYSIALDVLKKDEEEIFKIFIKSINGKFANSLFALAECNYETFEIRDQMIEEGYYYEWR